MSLEGYYNQNATVYSWVETLNELGVNEMATTYTSVINISLALQQLSKNESFITGTDRIIGTHRAYTAVNIDIKATNMILIIGSAEYSIQSIENPMQLDRHYEMILRLVK